MTLRRKSMHAKVSQVITDDSRKQNHAEARNRGAQKVYSTNNDDDVDENVPSETFFLSLQTLVLQIIS